MAIELQNDPFPEEKVAELRKDAIRQLQLDPEVSDYYVFTGTISNRAYTSDSPEVKIQLKNGKTADISAVSDMFDHRFISERITKYYLCYPKVCRINLK